MKKLILLSVILIVGCGTEPEDVYGCTVESACNFDSTATIYDESCWYVNEGCECADGAEAIADDCGICDADTINDNTTCIQDGLGVWGGSAETNDCISGTYSMTSNLFYNHSDCSGSGESKSDFGEVEIQLILNPDGTGEWTVSEYDDDGQIESHNTLGFDWTVNDNQVEVNADLGGTVEEDEVMIMFIEDNSLIIQEVSDDECNITIFTKI